ncbi:MAG: hypothetical protein EBR82_53375 [Caulobacteraceae bacterium]|nr:hypothetical protein [Caulobacteraceae bacterium]
MAKTIGQLTQATTLSNADEFVIEQSGLTKRVAASVVRGGLVNADIDAAAAIAHTKLANITAGRVLLGNASNVPTATALTGDVTVSNTGVTAIGSSKVLTAMVNDGAITAAKLNGAQAGSAPIYGCRAWVNFDGTTVNGSNECTIRGSGNVTNVVRNATGDYTVNFTTAMPDANYAPVATVSYGDAVANNRSINQFDATAPTASACRFIVQNASGTNENASNVFIAVFR